jgi:CspA family cold shock protein
MTETGTVAWFDLAKQFGFMALRNGYGDAFLHMSVLKEAGYIWLPRGTTVRVRIEEDGRKWRVSQGQIVEFAMVDPSDKPPSVT